MPNALTFLLATILLVMPVAALTEERLSAEEFDRYSRGKTLYYGVGGATYGVEQYLPNRRVIWAFVGDECRHGHWYEQNEQICFVYDHDPAPQCWTFYRSGGGIAARFAGKSELEPLTEIKQSHEPMFCPGPKVGV